MDNNEIIAKLIAKIDSKSNVKNNVFNLFFNEGNTEIDSFYPSLRYKNNIEDSFNKNINLPINKLKDPMMLQEEKNIKMGDNYILYEDLSNDIMISEKDFIIKGISKYKDIANNNTEKDLIEFQSAISNIIRYTESYKEELMNVGGKEFESLVSLVGEGNGLNNKFQLSYIPYEQIKNRVELEIEEKTLRQYLDRKKINKSLYKKLKHIYSTTGGKSLYDIYCLNDRKTELYLENISTLTFQSKASNGQYVAPKTDIIVTFFTLKTDKKLVEAFKERVVYNNETLNISVKQDTFISFHNVSIDLKDKATNKKNLYTELHKLLVSTTDNPIVSESIARDCIRNINIRDKEFNTFIKSISQVKIFITPTNLNFNNTYGGGVHNLMFKSKYKLGHMDRSSDKKNALKFLYGNFKDSYGNSNAMLHVKNKSNLYGIDSILYNIKPISLWNVDLINQLKNLNLYYLVSFKNRNMLNIHNKKVYLDLSTVQKNKFYIFSGKVNLNYSFDSYYFQGKKDLTTFSKIILDKINNGSRIKTIYKDYYEELVFILNTYGYNKTVKEVINLEINNNNKEMIKMFKKAEEINKKDGEKNKNGNKK